MPAVLHPPAPPKLISSGLNMHCAARAPKCLATVALCFDQTMPCPNLAPPLSPTRTRSAPLATAMRSATPTVHLVFHLQARPSSFLLAMPPAGVHVLPSPPVSSPTLAPQVAHRAPAASVFEALRQPPPRATLQHVNARARLSDATGTASTSLLLRRPLSATK